MKEIKVEPIHGRNTARGRNGSFSLRTVCVRKHVIDDRVSITAYSRRRGKNPPIWMELSSEEATELAVAILDSITSEACPVCGFVTALPKGASQEVWCLKCQASWYCNYVLSSISAVRTE